MGVWSKWNQSDVPDNSDFLQRLVSLSLVGRLKRYFDAAEKFILLKVLREMHWSRSLEKQTDYATPEKKKKKKTERRRCFVLFRIKYVFLFLFQSLLISATFPALGWWRTLCCKFFKLHIFLMPEHPDELTIEHLGQITICTSVIRLVPATNSPSCRHLTVTQWHSSATIKCSHAFSLCTLL